MSQVNTLAQVLYGLPLVNAFISVVVLRKVCLSLPVSWLVVIAPILFAMGIEAYNRFYLIIFFGLAYMPLFLAHSFLQPILLTWFLISRPILFLISSLLLLAGISLIASVDIGWLSAVPKAKLALEILQDNSCWKGEGNFGYFSCIGSIKGLKFLLFPLFYFRNIESIIFQLLILRLFFSKHILWVISCFVIYSIFNHNIASFYRNIIPLIILVKLTPI